MHYYNHPYLIFEGTECENIQKCAQGPIARTLTQTIWSQHLFLTRPTPPLADINRNKFCSPLRVDLYSPA